MRNWWICLLSPLSFVGYGRGEARTAPQREERAARGEGKEINEAWKEEERVKSTKQRQAAIDQWNDNELSNGASVGWVDWTEPKGALAASGMAPAKAIDEWIYEWINWWSELPPQQLKQTKNK